MAGFGALLGKVLGGGMGSELAVGTGAAQLGLGLYQKKKARAQLPGAEDLGHRQMRNILRRRRRAIETGTAGSSEDARTQQMFKSAGVNAFKAGGPMNFGMLNQLMSGASAALADRRGQELQSFLSQEGSLVDTMAQRRFDRQMLMQQEDRADAMQNISAGRDNLLAGIGVPSGKKKKKTDVNNSSSDIA